MKSPYNVLLRPVITEKSMMEKDTKNKVAFQVQIKATKLEIKKAIEKIFNVTVEEVRTMRVTGKVKRLGRFTGKKADWKKAIVTLKAGDKIEYFEGV